MTVNNLIEKLQEIQKSGNGNDSVVFKATDGLKDIDQVAYDTTRTGVQVVALIRWS